MRPLQQWSLYIVSIIIIVIFKTENCLSSTNVMPTLAVQRRSTTFSGNITIESSERDLTIGFSKGTVNNYEWLVFKDGFSLMEGRRVQSDESNQALNFQCVTSYDSGIYYFKQNDPTNTGYNIETERFTLIVIGNDTETLVMIREPSSIVMSGTSFSVQPIIGFGRAILPTWKGESRGRIEPVILESPSNGKNMHLLLQFRGIDIDLERKETTFNTLSLIGEPGVYRIGFIDIDTCEMYKSTMEITVIGALNSLYFEWSLSAFIVLLIIIVSLVINFIAKHKVKSKGFLSLKMAFLTPMESIYKFKGESIRFYFKSQRLLVFQCLFFTFISLVLFIPVTVKGDNKFRDMILLSQANWNSNSPFLFLYQVQVFLLYCSLIICYTRFNDERIYLSHDSNHLVTSRSVLLTGLPRSLTNVQMLKDFLQTGYSNGIYSASIILIKIFSQSDKDNDLNGRLEHIYVDPNTDINQLPSELKIESTGKAFITFSCVSDAHLFTNQFSSYKWTKSLIKRITQPVIPQEYRVELGTDNWRAHPAPRVSDILWTKLHDPANFRNVGWTILQMIGIIFFFLVIVFFAIIFYETQFSIIDTISPIDYGTKQAMLVSLTSYLAYYFCPSIILMGLNHSLPGIIRFILMRSNNYVRSFSKSKVMLITFIAQSLIIVIFPSAYFLINVNPDSDHVSSQNLFLVPIKFLRRGGSFYIHFITIFAMLTPFLELSNLSDIVYKILFHRNLKTEEIFSFEPLNLKKQYLNSLLLVMMIGCYGPIFPLLWIFVLSYLIVKFYLVKYVCIASKAPIPPSDKYFAVSFQQCIWFILTVISTFHFYYVVSFGRVDLMCVYIFLVVVAFGKYFPSCSKSLCYSFFDGAVLPCFSKDNGKNKKSNSIDPNDSDYYDDERDQDYYQDSDDSDSDYEYEDNHRNNDGYYQYDDDDEDEDDDDEDYEYEEEEDDGYEDDQVELRRRMYGNRYNDNEYTEQDSSSEEYDVNSPPEYYYDEDRGEFVQQFPNSIHRRNNNMKKQRTNYSNNNNNKNNNNNNQKQQQQQQQQKKQKQQQQHYSANLTESFGSRPPQPQPISNGVSSAVSQPALPLSAIHSPLPPPPPPPATTTTADSNTDSNSGLHDDLINEYLKEPNQDDVKLNIHHKSKLKQKILKIKQSYTQDQGFGFMSRFFGRYKLPTPESMTVITYLSPYFGLDISQCENVKDIEEEDDDQDINDDDYEYDDEDNLGGGGDYEDYSS
ncbi:hypothetical protein ACTFIZ_005239 [Dictyostelium cf. discoideum]